MASIFQWAIEHGAQGGTPTRGATAITGSTVNCSFKNVDDTTTAYTSSVITAGNSSFDRHHYGVWTGSFNEINSVRINHISGVFGAGISLKFQTGSANASNWYTTPSASANANLTQDLTGTGRATVTGVIVHVGATGAFGGSKAASTTSNPAYSQYLSFQLQSQASASAGDVSTPNYALELSWAEN